MQAYTCLGVAYIEQDRAAEAIKPLRKAIGINPDSVEVYYYLGDAFSMEDERTVSLKSLRTAMSLEGSYMVAPQKGGRISVDHKESKNICYEGILHISANSINRRSPVSNQPSRGTRDLVNLCGKGHNANRRIIWQFFDLAAGATTNTNAKRV